jgi:hypothetical protein
MEDTLDREEDIDFVVLTRVAPPLPTGEPVGETLGEMLGEYLPAWVLGKGPIPGSSGQGPCGCLCYA